MKSFKKTSIEKIKLENRSKVEYLSSIHEALGSRPRIREKKYTWNIKPFMFLKYGVTQVMKFLCKLLYKFETHKYSSNCALCVPAIDIYSLIRDINISWDVIFQNAYSK